MLVIFVRIIGNPMCYTFPRIILVTLDLGRTLEYFDVMLSLLSLGLTMGTG
jgi:hypothetical protein